jgi:hypothetical protein
MEIWIALVGGIILGWVLEWIIDWVFWRRGVEQFYATEADLRRQLAEAQSRAEAAEAQLAEVRAKPTAGGTAPARPAPTTQTVPSTAPGREAGSV